MRLENGFDVPVPASEAWALLTDVPRVVPCMPGTELTETVDGNRWKARLHVKLGPVALEFDTDVVREVEDAAARRVVLSARARERRGRGSAQATIESSLGETAAGTTRVAIVTELNLQGAVAQYGRGIVPEIAAQLTKQFAENVAALLEQPQAPAAPAAPAAVTPVRGLRLGLRALWATLVRLVRRG